MATIDPREDILALLAGGGTQPAPTPPPQDPDVARAALVGQLQRSLEGSATSDADIRAAQQADLRSRTLERGGQGAARMAFLGAGLAEPSLAPRPEDQTQVGQILQGQKMREAQQAQIQKAIQVQEYVTMAKDPAYRASVTRRLAYTQAKEQSGGQEPPPDLVATRAAELQGSTLPVLSAMQAESVAAGKTGAETAKSYAEAGKAQAEAKRAGAEIPTLLPKTAADISKSYSDYAKAINEVGGAPMSLQSFMRLHGIQGPAAGGPAPAPAKTGAAQPAEPPVTGAAQPAGPPATRAAQSSGKYGLPGYSRAGGAPLPSEQELDNLRSGVGAVDEIRASEQREAIPAAVKAIPLWSAGGGVRGHLFGVDLGLPRDDNTKRLTAQNEHVRQQIMTYYSKVNPGRSPDEYSANAKALLPDPTGSDLTSDESKAAYLARRQTALDQFNRAVESKIAGYGYAPVRGAPAARPAAARPTAAAAAPGATSLPQAKSVAEARALPPGTHFLDPSGVERVR